MENRPLLQIIIHSSIGGKSHIKSILELSLELQRRNHQVIYAALEDYLSFADGYNITTHSLGPPVIDNEIFTQSIKRNLIEERKQDLMPNLMKMMKEILAKSYQAEFDSLQRFLYEKQPDLIICDIAANACLDLAKIHGIPLIIGVQSTDSFRMINEPYITRIAGYGPLTTEHLSFVQRIHVMVIEPLIGMRHMWSMMKPLNQIRISKGLTAANRVFDFTYGLGLANTFYGLETPSQTTPSLKMIGPIISAIPQLGEPLREFFANHSRVIYVAFGSHIIPSKVDISNILNASLLALENNLVDGIIWGLAKSTKNNFPSQFHKLFQDSHFMFVAWAPQRAILEHNNTKLFVSHGGQESSIEAIYSGTPVICMAYLSDQPRNAAKLEAAGVGLYVDRITATPISLYNQFIQLVTDQSGSVQSNLNRMKKISRSSPHQLNYAVDLIESHAYIAQSCRPHQPYILKSSLPPCELSHLVPASVRMSFIQANLIDIYTACLIFILLLALLFINILIKLFIACQQKFTSSQKLKLV